jgi:hypothetical protein
LIHDHYDSDQAENVCAQIVYLLTPVALTPHLGL